MLLSAKKVTVKSINVALGGLAGRAFYAFDAFISKRLLVPNAG